MVYIDSWQEYQEAAENLYTNSPKKTRYSVKWKSSEGKLVLKITDDVTCLKFKTHSSIFLGRFEALNRSLIQKMINTRPPPAAAQAPVASTSRGPTASPAPQGSTLPDASVPVSTPSGGGVKKKKGKKK
ncbi:signal recognition particle, SRP9/SRP14 subunit [Multifurca ochricompacta]|uniref:Signal recognition particle, SRP9/SRP14 subunit n=1 Tax=Multifurca ochricompacta TaxID=376703 RepID=A0AAD4MFG2_9AGAM|nr:signal recognition particle, SRP9/SRP14 subunit [Multifurca ochricompacta]